MDIKSMRILSVVLNILYVTYVVTSSKVYMIKQ